MAIIMCSVKRKTLDAENFLGHNNVMARPRKDERLLMKVSIRLPLTEDQKKLIEEAASLDQSDLTAWARPILLAAARHRITKVQEPRTRQRRSPGESAAGEKK